MERENAGRSGETSVWRKNTLRSSRSPFSISVSFLSFHLIIDISDASRFMDFEGTGVRYPVSDATISAVEVPR